MHDFLRRCALPRCSLNTIRQEPTLETCCQIVSSSHPYGPRGPLPRLFLNNWATAQWLIFPYPDDECDIEK